MLQKRSNSIILSVLAILVVVFLIGCDGAGEENKAEKSAVKTGTTAADKTEAPDKAQKAAQTSEAAKTPKSTQPKLSEVKSMTETQSKEQAAKQAKEQAVKQAKKQAEEKLSPCVLFKTNKGEFVIELDPKAAPVTVENFLRYANEGFFNGTIFHRVMPNFMVQGGGFSVEMAQKQTHAPIVNEASNGLKNDRGTVAMARTNNPDSATAQFFINVKDNAFLNYAGPAKPGYAVFGKVQRGMEIVDAIVAVKTANRGPHANVPVEPVIIETASLLK